MNVPKYPKAISVLKSVFCSIQVHQGISMRESGTHFESQQRFAEIRLSFAIKS